jgi:hypothetical protein
LLLALLIIGIVYKLVSDPKQGDAPEPTEEK